MVQLTYILITRKLFTSAIWTDNPHILKLFLYFIGTARRSEIPKKYPGFSIKQGELVTSLNEIANNNEYLERKILRRWSKQKVARMIKYLVEKDYIEALTDTYGTHIKVLNYWKYQNPKTYLADTCGTGAEQVRNRCGTGAELNKNVKNVKNEKNTKENIKEKYLDDVRLTKKEYLKLIDKFGSEESLKNGIEILNNYKMAKGKRYKSDYHAMLNWVVERIKKENGTEIDCDPDVKDFLRDMGKKDHP